MMAVLEISLSSLGRELIHLLVEGAVCDLRGTPA